jgi:hypothetical protein
MSRSNLEIALTGAVQRSNFDEFREDLIRQILEVKTELVTDQDFAVAEEQSKELKGTEKSLKAAKQAAISQVESIHFLFVAIDEVAEEARQTRLKLDRQIKERKSEIKEKLVEDALATVRRELESQTGEFYRIDWEPFLERSRFAEVVKGKRSLLRVKAGVAEVIGGVSREIRLKARAVERADRKLEQISSQHRPLFQDRDALLDMSFDELEAEIEKRIRVANAGSPDEQPQPSTEAGPPGPVPTTYSVDSGLSDQTESGSSRFSPTLVWDSEETSSQPLESEFSHRVVVELRSSWGSAEQIAEKISQEVSRDCEAWRVTLREV